MTAKRIAVKRYVVKLSEAERERLNTLRNVSTTLIQPGSEFKLCSGRRLNGAQVVDAKRRFVVARSG